MTFKPLSSCSAIVLLRYLITNGFTGDPAPPTTFKGEPTEKLRKVARKQGMRTLFEDGIIKALKGQTTIDEVLRITHHEMTGA
jgi:type II secretory ATPase GspE/PulE/Tfp pilus assembly ATPase PilB-like protein